METLSKFDECLEALPAFAGLGTFGFLGGEADGGEGGFDEFVYAGADEVGWLVTIFTVMSSGILDTNFNEKGEPIKKGIVLVQEAFKSHFMGEFGYTFIAICLLFFAFSTIIGWYYFEETNIRYRSEEAHV